MKAARPTVFWSARRRYWGAGRFAMREYLVSELEPTAAPKTIVGAPQTFAQEDQPLERSRRRISFHYACRRHQRQSGARVEPPSLSARAALTGATVQALVEQAIDEFLAKSA